MDGLYWRLLLALVLGSTSGGRGGPGTARGGGGGLSAALGALGPLGSGPLGAVVGPRLMARLVEGEAVRRVVEAVETPLTRYYFDPATRAVCNDNSPAGFYFRRSKNNSPRWIVFLEGGWYCFDRKSCEQRWHGLKALMTSRGWPETRQVGGILSPDPKVNPHWWEANHVFVPYCSSDSWSGTRFSAESAGGFSFMGSVIIENVIAAVVRLNLTHGHKLILAGSSAGGVGAMVNVDRVSQQLIDQGIDAEVRAVSDSGWFLDNEPFAPLECLNAHNCPPVEAIRRGQKLWHGRIPNSCLQEYPQQPWYCYFGYRAYPTMKSPLFVFQWVFDEAQMTADNVGKPISKEQWDYIHGIGERLRKTFENVTALFAPSCISHTVLTKKDWINIKIGDVSLPQALNCWDAAPTTALNTLFHQRVNRTIGPPVSPSPTTNHRLRHNNGSRNRQRTRPKKRRRDKGQSGRRSRLSDSSEVGDKSGSRIRAGKTRGKDQTSVSGSRSDRVQSGHLHLVHGDSDINDSAGERESALVITANITVIDPGRVSTRTKLAQTRSESASYPQGLSRSNIPHGEMLADSPGGSASVSSKNYRIESNAIDTPQVRIQKGDSVETPKRKGRGDNKDEDRRTRRRNRKKKKGRGKEKKRKKKRRERRKKQKERRRKLKEKRKKKRTRLKGVMKTKEIPGDRERSARSIFLLHSKQSALHQTQPVSAATVSLSLSNTASLSDILASSPIPVTLPLSTMPLHSNVATSKSTIQLNSVPMPSPSSSLVSTIVPSLTTHSGSQTIGEDIMMPKLNDAYSSDLCPAHTLHLTDNCAWPHCNYACPKLLNPFTGEEMNFLDLLKSFGLDMASIANALGIDIHTLNSMGNDELLLILTQ